MTASRLVIIGGPKTGKTTLANDVAARSAGASVYHTDDLLKADPPLSWSEQSEMVARWFNIHPAPWIVEGVTAVRALRKWLYLIPSERPCDIVLYLTSPVEILTLKGQVSMTKAVRTVFEEIESELIKRGVRIMLDKLVD